MEEEKYTCDLCDKQFKFNAPLLIHKRIHTGEKPFICNICDKKFRFIDNFQIHKRIHTGKMPFSCNICDKKFTQQNHLSKHKLIHTGHKPFSCNICDKSFAQFPTESDLETHQHIHEDTNQHDGNALKKNSDNSVSTEYQYVQTDQDLYSCEICHEHFSVESDLKMHKHIHGGNNSHQFTNNFISTAYQYVQTIQVLYSCNICQARFYTESDLKMHLSIHESENFYAYNTVEQNSESCISTENQYARIDGSLYSCKICPEEFCTESELKLHQCINGCKITDESNALRQFSSNFISTEQQYVQTDGNFYSCNICSEQFYSEPDFKIHLAIHEGENPHVCNILEYSENCISTENQYVQTVGNLNSSEICHEQFSAESSLGMHILINEGEKVCAGHMEVEQESYAGDVIYVHDESTQTVEHASTQTEENI